MSSGVLFIAAAVLVANLVAPSRMFEQTSADGAAVRSTTVDDVEGFNEGDSTKHVGTIRPDVFLYGFWVPGDSTRARGRADAPVGASFLYGPDPGATRGEPDIAPSTEFDFTTALAWRA
jgi:hypothetical protein